MSKLYGFDRVTTELQNYTKPILLLGHEGSGRRTWVEQNTPDNLLLVKTSNKKSEMVQVEDMLVPGASFVWVLHISRAINFRYLSSLLRRAESTVIILIYSDVSVPSYIEEQCFTYYAPYLTDDQMRLVCAEKGLKEDETEFAVQAADGIPGKIDRSFELLRSRKFILEFLENVRDNNAKALSSMVSQVTQTDIDLLYAILTSFHTGQWSLFTSLEVEPLRRVVGLLEACLDTYSAAAAQIIFSTIAFGTLHAYHGRV